MYAPKDSPVVNIHLFEDDKKKFLFLHNFLPYLFGENNIKIDDNTIYVKNKLLVTFIKQLNKRSFYNNYLIFKCENNFINVIGNNEILLDFGDNMGLNRFVLPCLTHKTNNKVNVNMTSIFLPIVPNIYWSYDKVNLENIKSFCKKAKQSEQKIILLLGSLEMVFHEDLLTTWLKMQKEKPKYVFIVVGGHRNEKTKIVQKQYKNSIFFSKYVEFEDVIKMVDFCITNCGAGSVAVPLVYGIPQSCSFLQSGGYDKESNCNDILKYNVGPICRSNRNMRMYITQNNIDTDNIWLDFFINMMKVIDTNFNIYKENAIKIKTEIQNHSFEQIMIQFLNDIQDKNSNTQQELIKTGIIPEKYVNKWTCTI